MCQRWFATRYAQVFAVTNYVQIDLKNQAFWEKPRRYYHFVNTDRFKPDRNRGRALRTSLGCRQRLSFLLSLIHPEKGVDVRYAL